MRMVFWIIVILALGACAPPPKPEVNVVADTYCATAKKRTWSVDDTPESIQEAVTVNAGIDRACGVNEKKPPQRLAKSNQ